MDPLQEDHLSYLDYFSPAELLNMAWEYLFKGDPSFAMEVGKKAYQLHQYLGLNGPHSRSPRNNYVTMDSVDNKVSNSDIFNSNKNVNETFVRLTDGVTTRDVKTYLSNVSKSIRSRPNSNTRYFGKVWISKILNKVLKKLNRYVKKRSHCKRREDYSFYLIILVNIKYKIIDILSGYTKEKVLVNIERTMNVSAKEAKNILKNYYRERQFQYFEDEAPNRPAWFINRLIDSMELEYKESYVKYCLTTKKSWILTTIHMGNTQLAFSKILSFCRPGTTVISIFHEEQSYEFYRKRKEKFKKKGIEYIQVSRSELNLVKVLAMLRGGNAVCIMFFDLPNTFGRTQAVPFLGQYANFPIGVAELSVISKCPIIPIFTFTENGKRIIKLESKIDPETWKQVNLDILVKDITSKLASCAERYINNHPEQWLFIGRPRTYSPIVI